VIGFRFTVKLALILATVMFAIGGCRSRTITISIHNGGEHAVRNVEVQYPGGSYGAAQIGPGYTHGYKIKPRSAGTMVISYVDPAGNTQRKNGPRVAVDQEGELKIIVRGAELSW
jgi:hypothetical protein